MVRKRGRSVKVTVNVDVPPKRQLLRFGRGNAKLDEGIWTFSLPAGHFCPGAKWCLAKANRETGRIETGPDAEIRCYAASGEVYRHGVRWMRWHNAELVMACKSVDELVSLILDSLSPYAGWVRMMESGDFHNQRSFDAWLEVAQRRPETRFYGYSKSIPLWLKRLDKVGTGREPGRVPNFILTASYGGRWDHLIEPNRLRSARVIIANSVREANEQAASLGLEIDHDDSHAMSHGPDFALLIHGMQPAKTEASRAIASLRKEGEYGYGKRADKIRAARLSLPTIALTGE